MSRRRDEFHFQSFGSIDHHDRAKVAATRLVVPITLVGLTALSVDTRTKHSTLWRAAASIIVRVPNGQRSPAAAQVRISGRLVRRVLGSLLVPTVKTRV